MEKKFKDFDPAVIIFANQMKLFKILIAFEFKYVSVFLPSIAVKVAFKRYKYT